ncbi:MAG: zinc-dependent metalloprotease, partial [Bacteroidetes bacterium]|nr:zinc-dependent metalloprotease [Bacteroidota bacterium]
MKNSLQHLLGLLLVASILCMPLYMNAQARSQRPASAPAASAQNDTVAKAAAKEPAALSAFIKPETSVMRGLTPVYLQEGRYYLAIHDTLIGRDILMVTRLSQAAAAMRNSMIGYGGDQVNSAMLRFDKGLNNRILLRKVLTREQSKDSTQSMYASLMNSNFQPILANLEIKALSDDQQVSLIDVTDLITADNEALFLPRSFKTSFRLGNMQSDKSYMVSVRTYPINTEFRTVKTYSVTESSDPASYEINCSMVLLPKTPMQPRYADPRVGYFSASHVNFDHNPQGVETVRMITRWRLEPKPEDVEKYRRGELVEPAKPIIYYIDPATPKEWVPYLIQGVNDWQPVFEKAGFKNAIMGMVAPSPDQDSTWTLEDARFSAIVYKPSDVPNASGPNVHDPRSGEIIESHINWYHNVMSLVHNWYFVQCAAVDPEARKKVFDEELMGQLIRFVSSHEVGHTIGLRHNFGATSIYSTAQLRDPQFLKENGHTTSIMDYSRFNFVAQPEDNIPRDLLFPRISHYDYWAIEWGYRRFLDITDPRAEKTKLNDWIIEKTKNPLYWFGHESNPNDPRSQSEDLGENQMEASELGIKNLKVIMNHLPEWAHAPNEDFSYLRTMRNEIQNQFGRYLGHVAKWVGGIYENPKTVGEVGSVYTYVEKQRQQEAMQFLNRHIFTPPVWLVTEDINALTGEKGYTAITSLQNRVITALVSKRVLNNLQAAETELGKSTYTIDNLFNDLNQYILKELNTRQTVDAYIRSLQKVYVQHLISLLDNSSNTIAARPGATPAPAATARPAVDNTDAPSVIYYQLTALQKRFKAASSSDMTTMAHYKFLENLIAEA